VFGNASLNVFTLYQTSAFLFRLENNQMKTSHPRFFLDLHMYIIVDISQELETKIEYSSSAHVMNLETLPHAGLNNTKIAHRKLSTQICESCTSIFLTKNQILLTQKLVK
jgi:hypothetical protein